MDLTGAPEGGRGVLLLERREVNPEIASNGAHRLRRVDEVDLFRATLPVPRTSTRNLNHVGTFDRRDALRDEGARALPHRDAGPNLVVREAHADRLQRRSVPPGGHSAALGAAFPRNDEPQGLEPAQPPIAPTERHSATTAQIPRRHLFRSS